LLTEFTRRERLLILDGIVYQLLKAKAIRNTYFLAEVLAYLSYHHLYEVLNVIVKVSKDIDQNGEEHVSRLRSSVKADEGNIAEVANEGIRLVLLIRLRRFLQEVYTLTDK
jgi:hypothetical protein